MIFLMSAAALAAAQAAAPSAAATTPMDAPQHQMQQMGTMDHMGDHPGMGTMAGKQMADCHRCCEEMMQNMHHGHARHGHAG